VRDLCLLAQTVPLELAVFALDAVNPVAGAPRPEPVAADLGRIRQLRCSLGPVPLGLGTFEAAGIAMMHLLGITIEGALAGTLILCGLTFWLPMLPGLWLARREIASE
jgi:glycosyltransferase 2 family protein